MNCITSVMYVMLYYVPATTTVFDLISEHALIRGLPFFPEIPQKL